MFAIRDPRTLFRYTAIFAYILVGLDVLNIISAVHVGDLRSLVVCIITGAVALICGFVFYLYISLIMLSPSLV